jgi:hypothetical protein
MKNILLQRFLSLSLRTHIVLLAFLLAMPAVVLIVKSGLHERNDSIENGIEETRRLVYSIASEQNDLAAAAQQLVTVLAMLPEVKGHDDVAANAILADVIKLNPQFGNIVITDRVGDVWASALPMKNGFSLRDKRTYQNALNTGRFSSGEYIVGQISAKRTIGFGYPLIGKRGELKGVIAVNINFDHFNDIFKKARLPAGTVFSIMDYHGVIIDRNLNPEGFIGKKASEDILLKILNGPDEDSYIDSGGTDQKEIISYRKLRLKGEQFPYLCIRVSIPLQATLEKARHNQLYNMALLSLFLAGSIVLAILVGNYCLVNRIECKKLP